MPDQQYWCIDEARFDDITPLKALDILIECFFQAQKETFARVKKDLGSRTLDKDVRRSVEQAIKLAFKEAGHDFGSPSRRALEDVAQVLARKAASWGTPPDIIVHHRNEIGRLFQALAEFH